MGFLIAILALGVLIFIHEFGHFILAKIFGVKVIRFSMGLGPKLFGKKVGETEYAISAVPWGGYVRTLDEDTVEMVLAGELSKKPQTRETAYKEILSVLETSEDEMKTRALSAKPIWQRILIVLAGPGANFLFGVIIVSFAFCIGIERIANVVGEVKEESPAYNAGIEPGDRIIAVDGKKIRTWADLKGAIISSGGDKIKIKVERGWERIDFDVTPEVHEGVPIIGVTPSDETILLKFSLIEAIFEGFRTSFGLAYMVLDVIWGMLTSKISARGLGGPITIVKVTGEAAGEGLPTFLLVVFLISINLAVLNLLPIPVLDGGYLVFYLFELVSRRKVPPRAREVVTVVGLVIIISIMVFALFNDIRNIVEKKQ